MSDAPPVILATSAGYKSMADDTLRLTVDIAPADAQAALSLFGRRGSPVALARITGEAALAHESKPAPSEAGRAATTNPPPTRGPMPLSSKVAMVCGERSFAAFLADFDQGAFGAMARDGVKDPVAQYVREYCGVSSRSEITTGSMAARNWNTLTVEYELWQHDRRAA